jgi:polysaccharide export outer membrane protein
VLQRVFFFSLLVFLASSCIPYKNLVYLNEGRPDLDQINPSLPQSTYGTPRASTYLLRPDDVLNIEIRTVQESTSDFFNMQVQQLMGGGAGFGIGSPIIYFQGYTVNDSGSVKIPVVGNVNVAGLTVLEAEAQIDQALREYLQFYTVKVKLSNFRVTVLGEVLRPGLVYVFETKVSITQALAYAGIPPVGDLRRIRLIRKTDTGSEVVFLNLADPKILASDYYWLRPDDTILVQPLRRKALDANLALIGAVASIGSLTLLILNLFR